MFLLAIKSLFSNLNEDFVSMNLFLRDLNNLLRSPAQSFGRVNLFLRDLAQSLRGVNLFLRKVAQLLGRVAQNLRRGEKLLRRVNLLLRSFEKLFVTVCFKSYMFQAVSGKAIEQNTNNNFSIYVSNKYIFTADSLNI